MQQESGRTYEGVTPEIFVSERIRRITEALYRVSEMLPDAEPLRWSLRREALRLFEDFAAFGAAAKSERRKAIRSTSGRIARVLSFIELAAAGSYLSELNFAVLKREYESFGKVIREQEQSLLSEEAEALPPPPAEFFSQAGGTGEAILLQESESSVGQTKDKTYAEASETGFSEQKISEEKKGETARDSKERFYVGHSVGQNDGHPVGHTKSPTLRPIESEIKKQEGRFFEGKTLAKQQFQQDDFVHTQMSESRTENMSDMPKSQQKDIIENADSKDGQADKEKVYSQSAAVTHNIVMATTSDIGFVVPSAQRKHRIFEFIKKQRGPVGVRELIVFFSGGVSEKTLQRDLNAMVEEGFLRAERNKRWRQYAVRTA